MAHTKILRQSALKGGTALSTFMLVGAGLAVLTATPALAQDAADVATTPTGPVEGVAATPTGTNAGETEEAIVITGSRIPQPNLTSAAPVTVVSAQDIKLQGTTRIEDMLNSLPQVSAGQASGVSNDATGAASVDLRGLGVNRTLVLVNGRRLMPGDPNDSSADLNTIPESLVKRVEVLTGGASSTYGADAVAGVVNFIMDTDFEGIRLDGQYSFYQHNNNNKILPPLLDARQAQGFDGYEYPTGSVSDGEQLTASIAIGAGFDDNRGHVVAYFGYRDVNPVTQNNRDYSACTIQDVNADTLQCGGSSYSGEGNYLLYNEGTSTFFTTGPNRTLLPGRTRYNFAPTNYFQRPDKRYTAGFFAKYEVNEAIQPYLEFMFMDDRTLAQIAPSGNFANTTSINCDNPLIGAQQKAIICSDENLVNGFLGAFPLTSVSNPGADPVNFIDPTTGESYQRGFLQVFRRNVEGGPRIADLQHTQFRGVVGTKGNLNPAFSYDAYYQYGRTNYAQTYFGEQSAARLTRAIDVVDDPRTPGLDPVCRSFVDGTDPTCVPYDVLGGTISPAGVAYVNATGFQRAVLEEKILSGSITGLLGDYGARLPWASDGVSFNVGAEYRKEKLDLQTDAAFQAGDLTGQGAPTLPIQGSFTVREIFGEVQVPIVQDAFIDLLSVSAAYRKSWYKLSNERKFDTDTWRLGLEFAPVSDIRFRGNLNRAVRAPNLQELFAPNIVALDGSADPCAGFVITAEDVGCLAQGLTVGQTVVGNPSGQYNGFIGGTPTLTPEKATTKTLGAVIQPRFLPRLALTIDWYDIKVKDAIQGFGSDAIINFCTATADPFACSLIQRAPVTGSLWLTPTGFIRNLSTNIGSVRTKGIDLGASYSQPVSSLGTLSFSLQGTWLDTFKVDNGLSEPYDCAGYYGATCSQGADGVPSGPNAKWRHKARVSFNMQNGLGLSLQWRHFGSVKVDFQNESGTTAGDFDPFSAKLKAQNWFDLAATYGFADHFNFRIGVNNIFDKEPPLVSSGRADGTRNQCPTGPCNGNTYPAVYDALGRYLYAGVTVDF